MSILASLLLSFASDSGFSIENVRDTLPGYIALLFYTLCANGIEYLREDSATQAAKRATTILGTVGASILGLSLYTAREVLVSCQSCRSYLLGLNPACKDLPSAIPGRPSFITPGHSTPFVLLLQHVNDQGR